MTRICRRVKQLHYKYNKYFFINMTDDEIMDMAFKELQSSSTVYKLFSDFSFMKGLNQRSDEAAKIRYLLIKSEPFEEHTMSAIKFSSLGIKIKSDFESWSDYKKSLITVKPKKDWIKICSFVVNAIATFFAIYFGFKSLDLKDENSNLKNEKQALINNKDSLKLENNNLRDSFVLLKRNIKP